MKHLILSFVLATLVIALPATIFLGSRDATREISDSQRALEERVRALDERLGSVIERLEGLEGNKALLIPAPALSREAAVPASANGEDAGDSGSREGGREEQKLLAAILKGEDAPGGGLRDWVKQVMEDDRQERRQNEMRRFEEQQKEMQALLEGPYGQFNYRMNSLARTLGLDESQKARYFALLSEYAARFEDARKNVNREDAAEYKAYQDRKKAMHDEFETLVLQNLTLAQAETYQNLPDFEKTPDPKHMGGGDFVLSLGAAGAEAVMLYEKRAAVDATPPGGFAPVMEEIRMTLPLPGTASRPVKTAPVPVEK